MAEPHNPWVAPTTDLGWWRRCNGPTFWPAVVVREGGGAETYQRVRDVANVVVQEGKRGHHVLVHAVSGFRLGIEVLRDCDDFEDANLGGNIRTARARRPMFWWLRIVAAGAGHWPFSLPCSLKARSMVPASTYDRSPTIQPAIRTARTRRLMRPLGIQGHGCCVVLHSWHTRPI